MIAGLPSASRLLALLASIGLAGPVLAGDTPAGAGVDQLVARIPVADAPIAPVALARLNIALHAAKKQAAQELCRGNWLPDGEIVEEFGPAPVALADGSRAWLYEVSRLPRPLVCEQVSRAHFFQSMSRHLPAWVSVRPAGQATAYTQGEPLPLPHHGLAGR